MTNSYSRREKSHSISPRKQDKKSKRKHKKNYRNKSSSPEICNTPSYFNEKYDATGHKYGKNNSKKDICGYTDDINPFMDSNLTTQFVWKKKKGQTQLNCQEKELELENVRKRMREHERIREERLIEMEIIQRVKETQNFGGRKSDSTFDLEQAKIRSKIRITGGRGKPIDSLIQYVNEEENDDSDEDFLAIMHEPTQYLIGLSELDLNNLLVDIDNYSQNIDTDKNVQYWDDIRIIAQEELTKLTSNSSTNSCNQSIAKECVEDIRQMILQGTTEEAIELLDDAKQVLRTGDHRHIDVAYFEFFCQMAEILLARKRMKERHERNLLTKLKKLKQEQDVTAEQVFPINSEKSVKETMVHVREEYFEDKYEPVLFSADDMEDELVESIIYFAEDDIKKLEFMRASFIKFGSYAVDQEDKLLELVQRDDKKGDENFADQVILDDQNTFLWSDKYRPRKPRFLNRVNTGFDWNKYNQTHYDIDNPPPKIVQGYKFNILYPDLIDKSKTPTFDLHVCPENDQHAIITFKAGPPYQDIAFQIVNREWETSERYGYKCQFYRDMLQVHFHFKRYRYRK